MSWGSIQFWDSPEQPRDIIKGSGLYRWLTRLALGNSACDKKKSKKPRAKYDYVIAHSEWEFSFEFRGETNHAETALLCGWP